MKLSTQNTIWKYVFYTICVGVVALAVVVFSSCSGPKCQTAEIVNTNGCGMIDLGWCHTILELENGTRVKIKGEWGEVGDTITVAKYGEAWRPCEETE